jgi:hypothetical protein
MQSMIFSATFLTLLIFATGATAETTPQSAKATFAVHCYDVGASALDGKPGVLNVERGWSGGREINRITYDPRDVSIKQLENWLKAAGTYVSTVEQPMNDPPAREMPR